MVDTGELENYLNDKSAKANDIVEIMLDGVVESKEDPLTKRKYKVLNLPVKCNGRDLIFSPNKDALKVLNEAWGTETMNWIGKKFRIQFYPKTSFGKTTQAILPRVETDEKVK